MCFVFVSGVSLCCRFVCVRSENLDLAADCKLSGRELISAESALEFATTGVISLDFKREFCRAYRAAYEAGRRWPVRVHKTGLAPMAGPHESASLYLREGKARLQSTKVGTVSNLRRQVQGDWSSMPGLGSCGRAAAGDGTRFTFSEYCFLYQTVMGLV